MQLFIICLHVCKLLITGIILAPFNRLVHQLSGVTYHFQTATVVDIRNKTGAVVLGVVLVYYAYLVGALIIYQKVGTTA